MVLGLDCAASEFFKAGKYVYEGEGKTRSVEEQVEYLAKLQGAYPILSIEDGMAEQDWAGWKLLTDKIGGKCQLVGDDIFVTNPERLRRGSKKSQEFDPHQSQQIGSQRDVGRRQMAQRAGYRRDVASRGKPRFDITDLAVATIAGRSRAAPSEIGSSGENTQPADQIRRARRANPLCRARGQKAFRGSRLAQQRPPAAAGDPSRIEQGSSSFLTQNRGADFLQAEAFNMILRARRARRRCRATQDKCKLSSDCPSTSG
jgi:hypothetical protein